MHTLFDFVSSVNAIQYGLSLLFILGFILFNEILKPSPFEGLFQSVAEDIRFIKAQGKVTSLQQLKKIALAPLYIMVYLFALPFLFIQGIAVMTGRGIEAVTSAGWSPVRAYFAGRKKGKSAKGSSSGKGTSE